MTICHDNRFVICVNFCFLLVFRIFRHNPGSVLYAKCNTDSTRISVKSMQKQSAMCVSKITWECVFVVFRVYFVIFRDPFCVRNATQIQDEILTNLCRNNMQCVCTCHQHDSFLHSKIICMSKITWGQ